MAHWVQELHFPQLEIPITIDRIDPILSNSNHNQDSLYLSNLDDMIGVRVFTPTVYFYKSKNSISQDKPVVQILRDALKRVLVPYYPFTGRLRQTTNKKLEVFFGPNQGVLLVEAHSDVALADLGDLSVPNPAWLKLIYQFPDEEQYKVVNMPLVIAQVTKFSCGGFSLGLRICHCLCDGFGAMQFLNAWAKTAKTGSLVLNPNPCWDREIFLPRDPPKIQFSHTEFKRIEERSSLTKSLWEGKPIQKCYRISRDYQAHLKLLAQDDGEFSCTSFDAMAAHVWRSWVKALDVKPVNYELRLTFAVNTRAKLKNPPLRDGFYGNALCVACATSTVERLADGRLSETARLVHEARLHVSEEYLRSTIDYIDLNRPERLEFGGKLTITQWTRFSIYESADFGWGKPVYAGPIDLTPTPQVCVFLPEGGEGGNSGAMVLCICLPECACNRFGELLMSEGVEEEFHD
ncbi:Omega-hydroxypalmitate O-feruloyl transferase [Handroanthus impetiginosus]|uniref:Omega-hydroxypalmitate O-feruloyl transferase n=1 Tax=Handroanthus impetiginosus TaxID=429701 RepID=A0A2G9I593_9LAMI|nr:Omega-hydroxypalmitate O-feruloyl transferase [Handroanthus impetiginosus]